MASDLCGCERCYTERVSACDAAIDVRFIVSGALMPGWSYACETCGNKRCPHHADHRFVCTNDNGVGQVGVSQ